MSPTVWIFVLIVPLGGGEVSVTGRAPTWQACEDLRKMVVQPFGEAKAAATSCTAALDLTMPATPGLPGR